VTLLMNLPGTASSPTRCHGSLESLPPRRASVSLLGAAGLGMSCWPRSSFRRRPAKEDAFPKTEVPSTVRHRAGLLDLSKDLVRFELSVTPSTSF